MNRIKTSIISFVFLAALFTYIPNAQAISNTDFYLDHIEYTGDITASETFETNSLEDLAPGWYNAAGTSDTVFDNSAVFDINKAVNVDDSLQIGYKNATPGEQFIDNTTAATVYSVWKKPDYELSGNEKMSFHILFAGDGSYQFDLQYAYVNEPSMGYVGPYLFFGDEIEENYLLRETPLGDLGDYFGFAFDVALNGSVTAYYALDLGSTAGGPFTLDINDTLTWTSFGTGTIYEVASGSYNAGVSVAFNPEPSSIMLLLSMLSGGFFFRRKKQSIAV
ncbi:MAG: PEP-CTERM sorting domain-containing protein [Chlamydiota bacterium]|nr:PEP-CTERM sorting domain-containing protein [Chlamydiota bacterium]